MAANGAAVMDFKPIDFDPDSLPPEAAPGEYVAKIDAVKIGKTKADEYPMVIIEWLLQSTDEEGDSQQNSVGATVADFISFFPDGDKKGKMGKLQFRALKNLLELDDDVLPKKIQSKADFAELQRALKNAKATIYVTNRIDKGTGEVRTGVSYTAPKTALSAMAALGDDEDDEKPAVRKPAAKKAKR